MQGFIGVVSRTAQRRRETFSFKLVCIIPAVHGHANHTHSQYTHQSLATSENWVPSGLRSRLLGVAFALANAYRSVSSLLVKSTASAGKPKSPWGVQYSIMPVGHVCMCGHVTHVCLTRVGTHRGSHTQGSHICYVYITTCRGVPAYLHAYLCRTHNIHFSNNKQDNWGKFKAYTDDTTECCSQHNSIRTLIIGRHHCISDLVVPHDSHWRAVHAGSCIRFHSTATCIKEMDGGCVAICNSQCGLGVATLRVWCVCFGSVVLWWYVCICEFYCVSVFWVKMWKCVS